LKHLQLKFRKEKRSGVAGILAALVIMAMLFTVTMSYFYFTVQSEETYNQALKAEQANTQQQNEESVTVYGAVVGGVLGFAVNNTGQSIAIVAFWIYNSTGTIVQYQNNTNSVGNLPISLGQGQSIFYSQTNIADNNPFLQYVIQILTSRGNTFEGTYPSSQSVSSLNAEVAAGLGSFQMEFSSFTWYAYQSGPQELDADNDYYQYCAGGVLCSGGNYVLDLNHPFSGSLVPEGNVSTNLYCQYFSSACGTRVPIAFSVNITNSDPTQATIVINSEANLWIMQTCDSGIVGSCAFGTATPVYVFYVMNVNPSTGQVLSTTLGSFTPITIPYGQTRTIFFGAACDLSQSNECATADPQHPNGFLEESITTDDQCSGGCNQGFVGEFAAFILFSGTKVPPQSVQVYGQNIPFESMIVADNVGTESELPTSCTAGVPTVFTLDVNNSAFSPSNITQVSVNATEFSSISASAPTGWTYAINNGIITWTYTSKSYWITPNSEQTFDWAGVAPPTSSSLQLIFPIIIHWYNGALQSLQSVGGCLDTSSSSSISLPPGAVAYVPIYLFNLQNTGTSTGTQVMINMNWNTYSAFLDNPVDNVIFFDSNDIVLNAWMENGTSNTATNSVIWVNLGSDTIGAESSMTIYLAIYPTGQSQLNSNGPFGEAPQLSSQFGKYDDGAKVFSLYANFQGSSLPAGWTKQGSAVFVGGQTSTGGVELVTGATNQEGAVVYGTAFTTLNTVFETSAMYTKASGAAYNFGTGLYTSGPGTGTGSWNPYPTSGYYASYQYYTSSEPALLQGSTALAKAASQTMPNSGTNYLFTQTYANSTSFQMSYTTTTSQMYGGGVYNGLKFPISYTGTISNSHSTLYFGASTGGSTSTVYLYWIRARLAPPNGVMPTVVLGTLTT
jgi:hypothetical protein